MLVYYACPSEGVSARVLLLSRLSSAPSLSSGTGFVDVTHLSCGPFRGAEAMQLPICSYILLGDYSGDSLLSHCPLNPLRTTEKPAESSCET